MGQSMSPNKYYAASEPPNMCGGTSKYVGESYRSICPSLLLIYLYLLIQSCLVLRNMEWLSIAYYVEKVGRILLIVDSGSGKAYRMDFRCVSGGSHKRNTQMVQILRLTDGNCIGMRFLHSASLQSK